MICDAGLAGLLAAEAEILNSIGADAAPGEVPSRQALAATTRFAALIASGLRTAEVAELFGMSDGRVR